MKKLLLETSFSKIYMIVMIIITLLILGSYFSYAMFTVTKEKSNAISIVTGNLTYKLEVDGVEGNVLNVPANSSKEFIVTLSNPNNRIARFNFYYMGDIPSNVYMGYLDEEGYNITPIEEGINLEQVGTIGSSNTYIIKVTNNSNSELTINLGVSVGLDYNDLNLPNNGHLFDKYVVELSQILLSDKDNNINTTDSEQTFITGEEPDNYIWYSGKLWRAVSVDPSDNSVKLVTQWTIATIPYSSGSTAFEGSYMKEWLNDTSADGFLGNLRDYESFIKTDSKWNATMTSSTDKPSKTTLVTAPVGLLNIYEYVMSYSGITAEVGYLNNGLQWWALTPQNSSVVRHIYYDGKIYSNNPQYAFGIRPAINLKSSVKIVDGDGTIDNPYRLEGDNDTNLNGTLLNTRYSGEYISFGLGENNLYRIVSHENGTGTKITSAEPLKNSGKFITSSFGGNINFSSTNTIGVFLNGKYLKNYVDSGYSSMIEESSTWYLGTVGSGTSYKLAKYTNASGTTLTSSRTTAKVGLLRIGELMAGQFDRYGNNTTYWTLTPFTSYSMRNVNVYSYGGSIILSDVYGIKPSLNLKSNTIITGGTGLENDPFVLSVQ